MTNERQGRTDTTSGVDPIKMIQDAAGGAAGFVANGIGGAADFSRELVAGLGISSEKARRVRLRDGDGILIVPDPILDAREERELGELSDRYERLTEPGPLEKAGQAAYGLLPDQLKSSVQGVAGVLTQQELYGQMMKIVADGFGVLERMAAAATVSEFQVLDAFKELTEDDITSLSDICMLRAYEVARIANGQSYQHTLAALIEGGATGAVGFAGIPFNIVLSTFLYYRAVQSVAMFYGYDVRNDSSELVISAEVLSAAFAPRGADLGGAVGMMGKVMALAETATVGQVVKKGWAAMASRGGACLLIAQMRALAHGAARNALAKAGKEGLERSVFRNVLEQIGRRLPQKVVQRGVPVVGGIIGALFDAGQMQRTLEIADAFYHKRFLVEKEMRVMSLAAGIDLESGIDEVVFDPEADLTAQD